MSRKTPLVSMQEIGEINLTPLMDLTFILLITFIITFPLIEQGIPVELPTGEGEPAQVEESVSITLNNEGEVFLDQRKVNLEELTSEMQMIGRASPDRAVMVRADEGIAYGRVVEVMNILHQAKLSKLGLVTQTGKSVGP